MFASPKFSAYRGAPQSESESEDEERCLTRREQRASPQAEDPVLFVCGSVKAAPEPFDNSHIGFRPLELDCNLRDKPQPMETVVESDVEMEVEAEEDGELDGLAGGVPMGDNEPTPSTAVRKADAAKKERSQQRPSEQRLHKVAGNRVLHRKKKAKKQVRFATDVTTRENTA